MNQNPSRSIVPELAMKLLILWPKQIAAHLLWTGPLAARLVARKFQTQALNGAAC